MQSVLDQTYQNWECIVVDDLSTDDTDEVMQRWTSKDNRFQYYKRHREPKGAPTCRNIGLDKAKGEYVIFLDSDDLFTSSCIERRIQLFELNQDCDFLVFSTLEFESSPGDKDIVFNINSGQDYIERFLNMDVPWLIMAPIWKRSSFIKLGGWNENRASWQDWEMHLNAIFQGFKFIYFDEIDNYLRRDTQLGSIGADSLSSKHIKSHLKLMADIKREILLNKKYLRKLAGLIDWLTYQAIKKGNRTLALKALFQAETIYPNLRRIRNIIPICLHRKIKYPGKYEPDFGTMRKTSVE